MGGNVTSHCHRDPNRVARCVGPPKVGFMSILFETNVIVIDEGLGEAGRTTGIKQTYPN
jgi:hypothetical protein